MLFSTAVVLMPRTLASWLDVIFGLFLIFEIILVLFGVSFPSVLFPTLSPTLFPTTLIQLKEIAVTDFKVFSVHVFKTRSSRFLCLAFHPRRVKIGNASGAVTSFVGAVQVLTGGCLAQAAVGWRPEPPNQNN